MLRSITFSFGKRSLRGWIVRVICVRACQRRTAALALRTKLFGQSSSHASLFVRLDHASYSRERGRVHRRGFRGLHAVIDYPDRLLMFDRSWMAVDQTKKIASCSRVTIDGHVSEPSMNALMYGTR